MKIIMMVHTMGTLLPSDNDRYTYLANMLVQDGNDVEIITSDYEHHKKSYRDTKIAKKHGFKIHFIHENQYKKNLSIKRIIGHISFALRLNKYLNSIEKPDIIYCAFPPIISAYATAKYSKKNKVKLLVDIQDLWPEAMIAILGNTFISHILFFPLKLMANSIYKNADYLVGVSNTFINRAKLVNKQSKSACVYLGTDSQVVDLALKESTIIKPDNEIWICYIGNFGNNYDFENLFKALHIAHQATKVDFKMMMIGDGDRKKEIIDLSDKYYKNTFISGYLPYKDMLGYLKCSDIAVNPINAGTASSVTNKVGDYAAAGVAVINSQDNLEYMDLVKDYNAGLNAVPENASDIAEKIVILLEDPELRNSMGKNNRRLFEEKFDRSKTNALIIDFLKE